MTEETTRRAIPLFADLAPTAAEHFKIYFYGAVLGLIETVAKAYGSYERALERFPFLVSYNNELAERLEGLSSVEAMEHWHSSLDQWERGASQHLPLRALRETTGLGHAGLYWLLTIGLTEEDERFGTVLEVFQGDGTRRPSLAFLRRCRDGQSSERFLRCLRKLGLVRVINPDSPRPGWLLQIPPFLWDALRGGEAACEINWARFRAREKLLPAEKLVLPTSTRCALDTLPGLLRNDGARVVIVRGPQHNGRHAALGAVAHALGRGTIELRGLERDDERWSAAGTLALLLNALPVVEFTPAPGETISLDAWENQDTPLGVVMGRVGGFSGTLASQAVTLQLDLPDAEARRELWHRALPQASDGERVSLVSQFRLSSGNIARVAALARTRAALDARELVAVEDVVAATRTLNREVLDSLARRLPSAGDLEQLSVDERTQRDLDHLERRCRHRERLPATFAHVPGGPRDCGIRALLCGPSGTGKSLAARLLAKRLAKDIYQLDLSAVINKYIGETEKNLHRVLECAEELDVVLLLDEGDALLTRRTDVANANDRYANLETSFLLQRLEDFQGILFITTNSRERIDAAFERRMDAVVEFRAPDVAERQRLWRSHLPTAYRVSDTALAEVSETCELTGGQIRNAAQFAALLAFDNGGVVTLGYIEAAVQREYLKQGTVCPLKPRKTHHCTA